MSERRKLLDEIDDDNTNLQKYPGKTPVIVQRDPRDSTLPDLPKPKMMIPEDFTYAQLLTLIRQKLRDVKNTNTHLYLKYNGARDQALFAYTSTVGKLHKKFAQSDGLLHVIYSSHPPEAPSECCCCIII